MQSTFFKLVRAGLKVILAIGIGVLVFLAVCFIARRYEAEETKRLFREHRDELKELGIGEIYEVNGSVFFEWNQRVLRMFPKGILYTEDEQRIPHWYHIEKIENAWYYYLYN